MGSTTALMIMTSVAIFIWAWLRKRAVFMFPSTWILLISALLYMFPALIFAEEINELSPYTHTALSYCSTFVLVAMFINIFRPVPTIESFFSDAPRAGVMTIGPAAALRATVWVLGLLTLWYLAYVPLRQTGLYGVLFDPENSVQLREESLKLIGNVALHYAYLMGFSFLCPLAFALLLAPAPTIPQPARFLRFASILLFLAFYVMLTGARVGLVNLAVVGAFYAMTRNGMRMPARAAVLLVLVVFLVPMAVSFLREQGRNEATAVEYLFSIGERIFLLPLLISGWFVEYAETHGYAGFRAAIGLGPSVDWTNLIALEFLGRRDAITIESVTTPSAFYYTYFIYFGWFGLVPAWLSLFALDAPVQWIRNGSRELRVPLLATCLFFSIVYVQTSFGTATVSHGYVLFAILTWWLSRAHAAERGAGVAGRALG